MKISEKQIIMLLDIAKDTLRIAGIRFGGYDRDSVQELINQIINQQSDDLINTSKGDDGLIKP
jgi:hypothetical protein